MKSVSKFLREPLRTVLRMALREASSTDEPRRERGWKLLMVAPLMLLFRLVRGGMVRKEKLVSRFDKFSRGE